MIGGTVLSPIFFAIDVNVIDQSIIKNCTTLKYADNLRILHCFKLDELSQYQYYQNNINALLAWSLISHYTRLQKHDWALI